MYTKIEEIKGNLKSKINYNSQYMTYNLIIN